MEILIKPVITEKMTELGEKLNQYGFIVNERANKLQIREAVEEMYGVRVKSVKTMIQPGKQKNRQTKARIIPGRTGKYKKAIVSLEGDDVIDFYSNI